MVTLAEVLEEARRLANAGQPQRAEQLYAEVLRQKPEQHQVYYLWGRLANDTSRHALAENLLARALAADPNDSVVHAELGRTYLALGRTAEAIAEYQRAVSLQPNFVVAHINLGNVYQRLNQLDEADTSYRQALRHDPNSVEAHNNLGTIHRQRGQLDEALACFQQVLVLNPGFAGAYVNLGNTLQQQGRYLEAIKAYQRAHEIGGETPSLWYHLGLALDQAGREDEAMAAFQRTVELDPDFAAAHNNLGTALYDLGRNDEALEHYNQAIALEPDSPETRQNRALVYLVQGDFERGWPEFTSRLQCKTTRIQAFAEPTWDGEPLAGRTLLVHPEQGLGDTLQFVRFLPELQKRDGRVVLAVQRALVPLLQYSGYSDVVDASQSLPAFDLQVPLLSLPKILKVSLNDLPWTQNYLKPSPELVEQWRRRLSEFDGFKIGINWQGNPEYIHDLFRSPPLAEFRPLAKLPGVQLFSLQKKFGTEQLTEVGTGWNVQDLGPDLDEAAGPFMDTAAVMKNLDLVVTSDTAVAHLAGALGVPAWVVLPQVADWRWLLDREDCPWYPSLRLFRQTQFRSWAGVFDRVAAEVAGLVSQRSAAVE